MVAQLLNQDADIEGGVEPCRRVKRFFEQNVDIHRLTVSGIRCLPVRRKRLIRVREVPKKLAHLA